MKEFTAEDVTELLVAKARAHKFLSTGQASDVLKCSEATVKRWCDADRLSCARTPGGHRKIAVGDLAAFMNTAMYHAHLNRSHEAIESPEIGDNTRGGIHDQDSTRSTEDAEGLPASAAEAGA
jgi:excisionase family DNA binding protein